MLYQTIATFHMQGPGNWAIYLWHTIKPRTPEHGTLTEQRNTPEEWRNS